MSIMSVFRKLKKKSPEIQRFPLGDCTCHERQWGSPRFRHQHEYDYQHVTGWYVTCAVCKHRTLAGETREEAETVLATARVLRHAR